MPIFKIKTSSSHKFSQINQVPYAGKLSFDADGNADADVRDEDELDKLFGAVSDLSLAPEDHIVTDDNIDENLEGTDHTITDIDLKANPELLEHDIKAGDIIQLPIEAQIEVNELDKSQDELNDIGNKLDNPAETPEELLASLASPLDGMNIQELRNLAQTSGFLEVEWKDLTKVPLRAYLKSKISAEPVV